MSMTGPGESVFESLISGLVEGIPDPVTAVPYDEQDDGAGWADDSASYDNGSNSYDNE